MHFPETGIGSVIAESADGKKCEAGIFGSEGVGPYSALLRVTTSLHTVVMQVGDIGLRMPLQALLAAMERSPSLNALLLRFLHVMHLQTSFTALTNGVHPIDQRLARWLLMCHDRSRSDDMGLTHDFLAIMLAVRRPSVTTSLHVLEGQGLIRNERGYVLVRNRHELEEFAGATYGQAEAEYRRVIGPFKLH